LNEVDLEGFASYSGNGIDKLGIKGGETAKNKLWHMRGA